MKNTMACEKKKIISNTKLSPFSLDINAIITTIAKNLATTIAKS
jgi:hypothetical protein